jgi:hypothetical protein
VNILKNEEEKKKEEPESDVKNEKSVRVEGKNCLTCLRNVISHLKETYSLNIITEKMMSNIMAPEFKDEIENMKLRLLRQYLLANFILFIIMEAWYYISNNYAHSKAFKIF